ncbi:hypothetical protein A2856_01565 [Candidatus Uhrbacteria bacterium RIFCSPHIGHO2_01_FULL_63_20]|uniref:Uncharacterized protein n=1 Tax=Candidatus Uhrbacteria bacterium RIFCSPHIGHO2_01_FULL_63_20 TaxID=1802385 RepID=A0A1F7TK64_9BACT|nr:MAG: hypothetical protein A2856_01565 [Candidatus Uhrbacteria bacterium RIFCSPHIGHO2_01_FULL_63_20]
MSRPIDALAAAVAKEKEREGTPPSAEVISVSETVSAAATAYESLRNTLEYDEEHLLRRNAIRRILKRRLDEEGSEAVATELLRELVWARYLPNKRVPETMGTTLSAVLRKYRPLFSAARDAQDPSRAEEWLLDVASSEVEYAISPPLADEALASFAYAELKKRAAWTAAVPEADRDLQLYIAVHRAILKSNLATLRFRMLTLYYPDWAKAGADASVVREVADSLPTVVSSVERQIRHPWSDHMFRLVRRYAVVFHLIRDVIEKQPDAMAGGDRATIDAAIDRAAKARYARWSDRLRRSVGRAVLFLLCTKTVLALVIELPYERLVLEETSYLPLVANILFHPLLLGVIGLSVSIPAKKNTARVLELCHGILGFGPDFSVPVKAPRASPGGALSFLFNLLYAAFFLITVGAITALLTALRFNPVSIAFFLFFLALVTFFGLKIRNSRRELVIVETGGGLFGTLADVLFLPIVRAGRWIALRAPRVNVFLFFFDYIVEAPFKGAIRLVEGWLAFLREKKEEI